MEHHEMVALHRSLVDELVRVMTERLDEIVKLNKLINDKHKSCDIIIGLSHHRHSMEEMNVASHDECVFFGSFVGDEQGVSKIICAMMEKKMPLFSDANLMYLSKVMSGQIKPNHNTDAES